MNGARDSPSLGFRNLAAQELELGDGLTLLWGANGAGKTNLLEALCLALAGHSCRTRTEREAIAFGEPMARVEVELDDDGEPHRSSGRSAARRRTPPPVDGKPAAGSAEVLRPAARGLPSRPPRPGQGTARRRAGPTWTGSSRALWPGRAEARRRYGRALAQRNALLGRVRAGSGAEDSLEAWEPRAGRRRASSSIQARRDAVGALAAEFARAAASSGSPARRRLRYAPRSDATRAGAAGGRACGSPRSATWRAGHTTHGPHLDELSISLGGRSVAPLRLPGRAANRAPRPAVRRAPSAARGAANAAADAARRRDERARPGSRERCSRAARRGRRPGPDHGHGGRAQLAAAWARTEIAVRAGAARAPRSGAGRRCPPGGRGMSGRRAPRPRASGRPASARAAEPPRRCSRRVQGAWGAARRGGGGARGRAGGRARRRGHDRLPVRDLGAGARPAPDRAARALNRALSGPRPGGRGAAPSRGCGSRPSGATATFVRDLQVISCQLRRHFRGLVLVSLYELERIPRTARRRPPGGASAGRGFSASTPASGKD